MSTRLHCQRCDTELPDGAHFCPDCGTSADLVTIDPFGVDEPPIPAEPDGTRGRRRGLGILVAVVGGVVALLWALSMTTDRSDDSQLTSPNPGRGLVESSTLTTDRAPAVAPTTRARPTTPAPTTTVDSRYLNDLPGPVLGDDVTGTLFQIGGNSMWKLDLASGEVERVRLDRSVDLMNPAMGWGFVEAEPYSAVVLDNRLITMGWRLVITDLSDGSQLTHSNFGVFDDINRERGLRLVGPASAESVWLADNETWLGRRTEPPNMAIEIGLDGTIQRRLELPRQFIVRSADGDDLLLDSSDGWWHYDTTTAIAERLLGEVVAYAPGLAVMVSCAETLDCGIFADWGEGPSEVAWVDADTSTLRSDSLYGDEFLYIAPDLSGALHHRGPGSELTLIDLRTGSRTDLGYQPIDPYFGFTPIAGTPWIIARNSNALRLEAIHTETLDQVSLEMGEALPGSQTSVVIYLPEN